MVFNDWWIESVVETKIAFLLNHIRPQGEIFIHTASGITFKAGLV
jgi:hypothetical protein